MTLKAHLAAAAAGAAAALAALTASAQTYPIKPVRIICAEVAGGTDFAARLITPGLSNALGQQVLIDNRGGAGGLIAFETAAKAPVDGYTLLLHSNALWTMPLLKHVSYDPVRDFAPITLVAVAPSVLVAHPSLPAKSVKDLVALAKARPGDLNYGSVGPGTPNQIAAELFKSMAGKLKIVEVPFKGGSLAATAIVGGEIHLMFASAASVTPHVRSGRLRALGVTSAERTSSLPEVPAIAQTLPGYEAVTLFGVFAPAKTPAPVIARLNKEIVQILATPDIRDKFRGAANEVVGSTPEQLASRVAGEMAKIARLVKEGSLRPE